MQTVVVVEARKVQSQEWEGYETGPDFYYTRAMIMQMYTLNGTRVTGP